MFGSIVYLIRYRNDGPSIYENRFPYTAHAARTKEIKGEKQAMEQNKNQGREYTDIALLISNQGRFNWNISLAVSSTTPHTIYVEYGICYSAKTTHYLLTVHITCFIFAYMFSLFISQCFHRASCLLLFNVFLVVFTSVFFFFASVSSSRIPVGSAFIIPLPHSFFSLDIWSFTKRTLQIWLNTSIAQHIVSYAEQILSQSKRCSRHRGKPIPII